MLAAMKAKISPGRLLIDGQWVDGSTTFDTINPATGEVLTQITEASSADINRAVDETKDRWRTRQIEAPPTDVSLRWGNAEEELGKHRGERV